MKRHGSDADLFSMVGSEYRYTRKNERKRELCSDHISHLECEIYSRERTKKITEDVNELIVPYSRLIIDAMTFP